jgi:hypothetical protein
MSTSLPTDVMYFAHDDRVVDQIPLAEISQVKEMIADTSNDESKDDNQLLIETHPEGYNSGRTYYLQAESKASCQDIIKRLLKYRKAAYNRAHAQSSFRQAQLRALKIYRSTIFQRLIGLLIISVRAYLAIFPSYLRAQLMINSTELCYLRVGCAVQAR